MFALWNGWILKWNFCNTVILYLQVILEKAIFDFIVGVCVCVFSHCPFSLWPLQVIHDFLFSLKESPEKVSDWSQFSPRRVLPCLPSEEWPQPSCRRLGLSHTEVLFVQDLTGEWHFFFLSLTQSPKKWKKKKHTKIREIDIIIIIIQYFF